MFFTVDALWVRCSATDLLAWSRRTLRRRWAAPSTTGCDGVDVAENMQILDLLYFGKAAQTADSRTHLYMYVPVYSMESKAGPTRLRVATLGA